MRNFFERIKEFISTREKISLAFFCIFMAFMTVGLLTLGGFNGTGRSYNLRKGAAIVYELEMSEDQKYLTDVYINVGNIYKEQGSQATLNLKRSSSSDGASWISASLGNYKISNVAGESESARNYNWTGAFTGMKISSSYKYIKLSSDCNLQINEIIFVGDNGKVISAKINSKLSQLIDVKEAAYTLDRQKSVYKNNSSMFRFSQSESYVISTINNIKLGSSFVSGDDYVNTSSFGSLGLYLIMLGMLIFGNGTFGARIIPFAATLASLYFIYKLFRLVFKNGRYSLIASGAFALSGIAYTLGRLAMPYSIALFFLLGSIYFMTEFYFKKHKSAKYITLSAAFFAAGIWIYPLAAPCYLVVFALFALGMYARKRALDKSMKDLSEEYKEKMSSVLYKERTQLKKEGIDITKDRIIKYRAEKRLNYTFFFGTFAAFTMLTFILSALSSYNYLVKGLADPSVGENAFYLALKQFSAAFSGGDSTLYSEANKMNFALWFFPVKSTVIYNASGEGFLMMLCSSMNLALALISLISLVYTAYSAVKVRGLNRLTFVSCAVILPLIISWIAAAFVGFNGEGSLVFHSMYSLLFPVALYGKYGEEFTFKGNKKLMIAALVLTAAAFILQSPFTFGYKI